MSTLATSRFQKLILDWYCLHGRHDVPWRRTRDPYRILVSEIMLQQTQVDRVIPKYGSFLKKFPTVQKLASAKIRDVIKEWQGLGYNRRAFHLHKAARELAHYFPRDAKALERLPGVGLYTACAVAVFAWNKPEILLETNVRRVFIHFFFPRSRKVNDKDILPFLKKTLYRKNPRAWYWALMDYGAGAFKHLSNPNRKSAHYARQSPFQGSRRFARAYALQLIAVSAKGVSENALAKIFKADARLKKYKAQDILDLLRKDSFIIRRSGTWILAE